MAKLQCYVTMGFGKKTDFRSGRTLNLDLVYKYIIKPAAGKAGYECLRGDEIPRNEVIDVAMLEQLLSADLVIADLSTSNPNAMYELGLRHALRPRATIIIAESGFVPFFDVRELPFLSYQHHGDVLDVEDAESMMNRLTAAILGVRDTTACDSPVYAFLPGLEPPRRVSRPLPTVGVAEATNTTSAAVMRDAAQLLMDLGHFIEAERAFDDLCTFLRVRKDPNLTDITQRLVLATYQGNQPNRHDALQRAMNVLESLEPETSNDPETLGLAGTLHQGLWEETDDPSHIDSSIRAYERGFYLRQDHHNGINLAFMFDVRAAVSDSDRERVADRVNAERVRRHILEVVEVALTQFRRDMNVERRGGPNTKDGEYWVLSTKAQALVGLGDEEGAAGVLAEAKPLARAPWMTETTETQLGKLRKLLAADKQA